MTRLETSERPRWRGRLHQVAFIIWVPAGIALVALGQTASARISSAVYAVSVIALYGVSAAYHRLPWSPSARTWMRRIDHSTIFVFIAGTYTPLGVLALDGSWRVWILAGVWIAAAAGIVLKMVRLGPASHAGTVMYVILGWTAIAALPQLVRNLNPVAIGLLLSGGLLYTAGAVVYALRKPDPNPRVFGFHEVYHSFVIGGSICHYLVIAGLVVSAA